MSKSIRIFDEDDDGILYFNKIATMSLCNYVVPKIENESDESWNEKKSKTYIYIPKSSFTNLEPCDKFYEWMINYFKTENFNVIEGDNNLSNREAYNMAKNYLSDNTERQFIDLSKQMIYKYICDKYKTIYKSVICVNIDDVMTVHITPNL